MHRRHRAHVATAPAPRAATPVTQYNGKTSDRAAPSCWAIKQSFPTSTSGLYWLLTPTLVRPQVFYCDMTTDGGGWELIGRGPTAGRSRTPGQGTASAVALAPTGTNAFAPATLPSSTVDGLLDGHAPSTAYDGFRIRRATNSAGTTWQEARYDFRVPRSLHVGVGPGPAADHGELRSEYGDRRADEHALHRHHV